MFFFVQEKPSVTIEVQPNAEETKNESVDVSHAKSKPKAPPPPPMPSLNMPNAIQPRVQVPLEEQTNEKQTVAFSSNQSAHNNKKRAPSPPCDIIKSKETHPTDLMNKNGQKQELSENETNVETNLSDALNVTPTQTEEQDLGPDYVDPIINNQIGTSGDEVTISSCHSTILAYGEENQPHPNLAHVSIVTIEDNGKDVTIKKISDENERTEKSNNISRTDNSKDIFFPRAPSLVKDEVVVVRDQNTPAKEVIIVSNEFNEASHNIVDEKNAKKLSNINDSDDQLSLKTLSSESSASLNENKPRIKVNLNLVSDSDDQSSSRKSSLDVDPGSNLLARLDRTHVNEHEKSKPNVSSSVPNGIPSSTHGKVKLESSDCVSCGSFNSLNSDKENKVEPASKEPQSGVVLRKKKANKVS